MARYSEMMANSLDLSPDILKVAKDLSAKKPPYREVWRLVSALLSVSLVILIVQQLRLLIKHQSILRHMHLNLITAHKGT